jgi:PKD repeat protein
MKALYCFFFFSFISFGGLYSQNTDCTADENCGEGATFPVLCPEVLISAVAGEYYEEIISIYLPSDIEAEGVSTTLEEVVVLSITGLPFGMELVINDDDLTFYPTQGDTYTCATLYGTPLLPGFYDITINVQVTVVVFGFEQVFNQAFAAPIEVLAGESSNNSFTISSTAGCGDLSLELNSLIDGSPYPTEYSWDFGNGVTSSQAIPEAQDYVDSGDYNVSLTTTIFQYELDQLVLNSISGDGSGDLDESFGLFNPDPYLVIIDGNGSVIFTTNSIDDVESATFSDLNILLSSEFDEFVVQIWDSDTFTEDDLLGQFVISNPSAGTGAFNNNGSGGSYNISYEVSSQFFDEEVVSVFPLPDAVLQFSEELQTLSVPLAENNFYQWTLNGEPLGNENQNTIELETPGIYQCQVTNEFGCSVLSEEYILCPNLGITFEDNFLSVSSGFQSYVWFYNGLELENETNSELSFQGDGNYSVEITTSYGCEVTSAVISVVDSVYELDSKISLKVYPNPASDELIIQSSSLIEQTLVKVFSLNGQLVIFESINPSSSGEIELNVSHLSPGVYTLSLENGSGIVGRSKFMK